MDKTFIGNIYMVFVMVRREIDNSANIELLQILMTNLLQGGKNDTFLNEVHTSAISRDYISNLGLYTETSEKIAVHPNFLELYTYVIDMVIQLLEEHSFEQAHDIVDAFHWLPESIMNRHKIHYVDFFATYVMPLGEKWGYTLVNEIFVFLPVGKFTKLRIWLKLKMRV